MLSTLTPSADHGCTFRTSESKEARRALAIGRKCNFKVIHEKDLVSDAPAKIELVSAQEKVRRTTRDELVDPQEVTEAFKYMQAVFLMPCCLEP